jgi:hypothetical protein
VSRAADPGLQPQRTELAWRRTGVAVAVNALLILRAGVSEGDRAALAFGLGVAAFALGFIVLGLRRRTQLARADAGAPPAGMMRFAAIGVCACAGGAFWFMAR